VVECARKWIGGGRTESHPTTMMAFVQMARQFFHLAHEPSDFFLHTQRSALTDCVVKKEKKEKKLRTLAVPISLLS